MAKRRVWWSVLAVLVLGAGVSCRKQQETEDDGLSRLHHARELLEASKRPRPPEGTRWVHKHTLTRKELEAMPWGAKGVQDIGVLYSGSLWCDITFPAGSWGTHYPPADLASMTACYAAATIQHTTLVIAAPRGGYGTLVGDDNAAIRAAVIAWSTGLPVGYVGNANVWSIRASVGGMPPVVQNTYVVAGYYVKPMAPFDVYWVGPTEINADFTISMTGAYRRATITQSLPADQLGLRHPAQRTGTGRWYADSSTMVAATCGPSSASGSFGAPGETDLTTGVLLGCTVRIEYNKAPAIHTPYVIVTAYGGPAVGGVAFDFSSWTFYKDTGDSDWHWHGTSNDPAYTLPPADADTYWKTVPSGNTITVHRCAGVVSGAVSWLEDGIIAAKRVTPRLWKQNKTASGGGATYTHYTDYDTAEGHPFDLGLYHHWVDGVQETDAEVSVAPLFSGYYEYSELWSFGVAVPDDNWRKFTNLGQGFRCYLRKDWLEANNEDVTFTSPLSTQDMDPLENVLVPCTFHNLQGSLTAAPWSSDWITWDRTELNLDKPDGTNRPSHWLPISVGQIAESSGSYWAIVEPGDGYARQLASRRPWRYERISAHLWTDDPNNPDRFVTYNWLLQTRPTSNYFVNEDDGSVGIYRDDPRWWQTTNGWEPVDSYVLGRIDVYEDVECSGECDEFTQRFFEATFPVTFAPGWWEDIKGEQYGKLPEGTYWHWATEGNPEPGDMLVFAPVGGVGSWHVGICHDASGVEIYVANANHNGDELGYFDTVSGLGMILVGWIRYQTGILFEDITDWRMFSKVALRFTGVEADQRVAMTIHYQNLTGQAPWYIGAKYNFGVGTGEARADLQAEVQTATVTGTLHASDGIVWFDLCPDAPDDPNKYGYVSKVEFSFNEPANLTFQEWKTIPYDASHDVSEVAMRINPKHSTDYFGARASVDGMPNYQPDYLYTLDTERVEVGYKHTQDSQHDADYTGPEDDPRYLKTLAEWYNEQKWAQVLLDPTWDQSAIDDVLLDPDDVYLGTPVWGDYDEDGFALHVGKDLDVNFPVTIVYCDFILQGGARGVAKSGGTRKTNRTSGVKLYYSDDFGTTKTLIRQVGTGYAGEYRVGTGREKFPRRYWVNTYSVGEFVNAEEVWQAVRLLGGTPLFLHIDRYGNMYTLYADGTTVKARVTRYGTDVVGTVIIGEAGGEVQSCWMNESNDVLYAGAARVDGTFKRWKSASCDMRTFTEI